MEITTETEKIIILRLTENEAKWLKDYVQNSYPGEKSTDNDRKMKSDLFSVLNWRFKT